MKICAGYFTETYCLHQQLRANQVFRKHYRLETGLKV